MKNLILTLLLFTSVSAFAQSDNCASIKKRYDEFKELTIFSFAPSLGEPALMPMKTVSKADTVITLAVVAYAENLNVEAMGIYIKFDDGTFFRNPDQRYKVEYSKSLWGNYQYSTYFNVDEKLLIQLKSKKIVAIQLSNRPYELTKKISNRFISQMNCISDAK